MRDHLSDVRWRKSSYSGAGNNCIEVADLAGARAVRDSKDPSGPALRFIATEWSAFTAGVRAGEFVTRVVNFD